MREPVSVGKQRRISSTSQFLQGHRKVWLTSANLFGSCPLSVIYIAHVFGSRLWASISCPCQCHHRTWTQRMGILRPYRAIPQRENKPAKDILTIRLAIACFLTTFHASAVHHVSASRPGPRRLCCCPKCRTEGSNSNLPRGSSPQRSYI
jgi:hypothetical protein